MSTGDDRTGLADPNSTSGHDNGTRLPLVSVCIPCYNASRFIEKTLRSVLEQSCPRVEIVVVDDGSTDGSPDIVRSLLGNRGTVTVQRNAGSGPARNAALQLAKGEFVMFLDADDFLAPNALETLVSGIGDNDFVFSDGFSVSENGDLLHGFRQDCPVADPVMSIIQKAPYPGSTLIRRRSIRVLWNDRYTSGDEFYFFAMQVVHGCRFGHIPQKLYYYRQHESTSRKSVLSGKERKALSNVVMILDDLAGALERAGGMTLERRLFLNLGLIHLLRRHHQHCPDDTDPRMTEIVRKVRLGMAFRALRHRDRVPGASAKAVLKNVAAFIYYVRWRRPGSGDSNASVETGKSPLDSRDS